MKEFSFELYTSDPKNPDFLTELLKNCSQLYDTEKEYVVPYDLVQDLVKEAQLNDRIDKLRETTFIIRVRLFSLKQEL